MLAYLLNQWLNRVIVNEFEFEIKPGERLPPETKIPLPEMSHAEELIAMDIPFENRVEFLSAFDRTNIRFRTPEDIAKELKMSVASVMRMGSYVGAEPMAGGDNRIVYPQHTLEVIRDEVEWQQSFDALDDYMSSNAISEFLAREPDWVEQKAYELRVYPSKMLLPNGWDVLAYPKSTVAMLRHLMYHFPPANDWDSIANLETIIGMDRDWIEKRINENNFDFQLRTVEQTGAVNPHYDPIVRKYLLQLKAELPPLANGWFTQKSIAQMIGKDRDWLKTRLEPYAELAESRLTPSHRVAVHYPPFVLEAMINEVAKLPVLAEDWKTAGQIAKIINKNTSWVNLRISRHGLLSEKRRDSNNREFAHYPPEVILFLEELRDTEN